jgi:glyoxylase-like metal-dependent hydrolase (beta-lactamase superfamily II)
VRIFSHFIADELSNAFLIGPNDGGEAILIDPGAFDATLLELIESNGFSIRAILVTNLDAHHTNGIRTATKIYDAEVFAGRKSSEGQTIRYLPHNACVDLAGFTVEIFAVPGQVTDALIYKVGNAIFTGDLLSAGRRAIVGSDYAKELIAMELRDILRVLPDEVFVFPGHGPPTTLGSERRYNLTFTGERAPFPDS